ncbi:MAG: helix-turn-helix domain-containing protein [Lachnospiraceae bacterium]|nr:helix-turn-helix domain-containing protein [Lachnospiraceae bacterium]
MKQDELERLKQDFYTHAGTVISAHRTKKGWSDEALGASVGVSKATLSGYENGKTQMPAHNLYILSKELGFEFSEYDPEIPTPCDIFCQIARFKRKAKTTNSANSAPGSSFRFTFSSSISAKEICLKEEHRRFIDGFFAYMDGVSRISVALLYEMTRQYNSWDRMPKELQSLFDITFDIVFSSQLPEEQEELDQLRREYMT